MDQAPKQSVWGYSLKLSPYANYIARLVSTTWNFIVGISTGMPLAMIVVSPGFNEPANFK
jgi:hypothetical protein